MKGSVEKFDFKAARIRKLPPYLFAEIDRMKEEAIASGTDVIDMGVGDPDLTPPKAVIETLIHSAQDNDAHHYASYTGLPRLRQAFAGWFETRFGIKVDPDEEVLPLLGSKEGVGHIFLAITDPGDEILVPDPGYPVYTAGAILAGAIPKYFPLRMENGFLPDIDELRSLISPHTKMLWLNYPSNPTTALATMDIFEEIVNLANEHGILVCQDAAYSEIVFDGKKAISLLQAPGAIDVGIEFHSLSKTFCMPGWRVGFAVGNAKAISCLAKVKTNLDSGIFLPVQDAAITALLECEGDTGKRCRVFENRRSRFVSGLKEIGWDVPLPPATFYIWAPIPGGYDSMGFAAHLLEKAGIVCTPGIGFGKHGEGFVRMSLTMPDDRLEVAIERIKDMQII